MWRRKYEPDYNKLEFLTANSGAELKTVCYVVRCFFGVIFLPHFLVMLCLCLFFVIYLERWSLESEVGNQRVENPCSTGR